MFKLVDTYLNQITMYRLALYVLVFLIFCAEVFSWFGLMPFVWYQLIFSMFFLVAVCWIANTLLAKIFRVTPNTESVYITAFILCLIILPAADLAGYMFLFWAGVIAMASKYALTINRKHVFNPAAIAVVATFYLMGQGASWWVGNMYMQIPILIGGILIVRKIRRWNMVYVFLATTLATTIAWSLYQGIEVVSVVKSLIVYSPLWFFAFIMFTEPATTPPTNRLQILYGIIVGMLASPFTHLGNFYFTPELALVAGNIFSFLVSPRGRLILTLLEKNKLGKDVYEFVFKPNRKLNFRPGQYLEWTLAHDKADLRGNRRYFTIASSPMEENVRLGIKFYEKPSSFKKHLLDLSLGSKAMAGQLAGDFILPLDPSKKLIFIAGGIGITPFRSMLKYLIDKNEKRPITFFFSNKTEDEIVYKDILDEAELKLGLKTIFTLTGDAPGDWTGERVRLNEQMIAKYVPDYKQRTFYVSGTHSMITSIQELLKSMGIPKRQIKTDFFPGFV